LLELSLQTSEALGMPVVAGRARSLLSTLAVAEPERGEFFFPATRGRDTIDQQVHMDGQEDSEHARTPTVEKSQVARIRREGRFWAVEYRERVTRLGDLIGLGYLYILLREPRRWFHVVELCAQVEGPDPDDCSRFFIEKWTEDSEGPDQLGKPGDLGPVIDTQGIQSLRKYLEALDEEIHQIERGDFRRASDLKKKREVILRYLKAALGWHGKKGAAGDAIDRLRQNIQKAIKRALGAIESEDSELGWYLQLDIKTGFSCSYQPNPRHPVTWQF
jgi:hypothetical protein